jgi:hypothetical protein
MINRDEDFDLSLFHCKYKTKAMIYAVHYAGCEHPRFQSCLYEAEKRVKEWNNIPEHEKHLYCEPVVLLKIKLRKNENSFTRC